MNSPLLAALATKRADQKGDYWGSNTTSNIDPHQVVPFIHDFFNFNDLRDLDNRYDLDDFRDAWLKIRLVVFKRVSNGEFTRAFPIRTKDGNEEGRRPADCIKLISRVEKIPSFEV